MGTLVHIDFHWNTQSSKIFRIREIANIHLLDTRLAVDASQLEEV